MRPIMSLIASSALIISLQVLGNVSVYDYVERGDHSKLGASESCAAQILKHGRVNFDLKVLRDKTVPLKETSLGNYFYHYTNAEPVQKILHADLLPREDAHQKILDEKGYESILEYSIGHGNDFRSIYMAADPFSSVGYGSTLVRYGINPEARVYVDIKPTGDGKYTIAQELFKLPKEMIEDCGVVFLFPLVLQESGVDIANYNRTWMQVVNSDIIESSAVHLYVNSEQSRINVFTKSKSFHELRTLDLMAFAKSTKVELSEEDMAVFEAEALKRNDAELMKVFKKFKRKSLR